MIGFNACSVDFPLLTWMHAVLQRHSRIMRLFTESNYCNLNMSRNSFPVVCESVNSSNVCVFIEYCLLQEEDCY